LLTEVVVERVDCGLPVVQVRGDVEPSGLEAAGQAARATEEVDCKHADRLAADYWNRIHVSLAADLGVLYAPPRSTVVMRMHPRQST
jgi:hypothetical protein